MLRPHVFSAPGQGSRCGSGTTEAELGFLFSSALVSGRSAFVSSGRRLTVRTWRPANSVRMFWISQALRSAASNSSKPSVAFVNMAPLSLVKLSSSTLRDMAQGYRQLSRVVPCKSVSSTAGRGIWCLSLRINEILDHESHDWPQDEPHRLRKWTRRNFRDVQTDKTHYTFVRRTGKRLKSLCDNWKCVLLRLKHRHTRSAITSFWQDAP